MADELQAVAEREGDPDLIDRIADERNGTPLTITGLAGRTQSSSAGDGSDLILIANYELRRLMVR